ncbi:sodium:proton antiporter [Halococcus dombrowskii]|nr:MnhB domain-containing protein [Halococcus dombrowskii]UOO96530.1 sodium:proton antiporter [Halococcus dombrowskii]
MSVITRTVTRVVFPLILLTALALLFQGHNLPGGGFIAGVLTVAAFALVYIVNGLDYLQEDLLGRTGDDVEGGPAIVADFLNVFAGGLAIAAGGGVVAILLGQPFLSQAVLFVHDLPIFHELELASAFVFDLGVYLVVVGGLLTILTVVGDE